MSPSSPTNRKLSNPSPTRNQLVERCSSLRGCEPCKRRKRICNGQKPCTHCIDASQDCVFSVVSDHPRSVFTTSTARRLSSGSACETCRRRKTKCDGGSPCGFCASSGIECINNSERRKRSIAAAISSSSSSNLNLPSTSSSLALSSTTITDSNDNEAIDRIEDRLRRIEKLMTAFSPSALPQQSQFTSEIKDIKRVTAGFRKLSSPHLYRPTSTPPRRHRHSLQGFSTNASSSSSVSSITSSDKYELKSRDKSISVPYASPPNSNESVNSYQTNFKRASSLSPPLSPRLLRRSHSQHSTNMVASSLLNLSLSPSSSTSSSSTVYLSTSLQPPASTPASPLADQSSSNVNDNSSPVQPSNEWKQSTPIPSLMDQLSKCTFVTTAMDYTTVHYPIYPISSDPTQVNENP